MIGEDKDAQVAQSKETNLRFYNDGYMIAATEITDFNSLSPLFKGIQKQYLAISDLTRSFGQRSILEKQPIACAKGCSWCCFQPVYLTTQEALLLYEYILKTFDSRKLEIIQAKAEKKLKKTKHLAEEKKQHIIHACPFLEDNSCSVYPVRPMACRIYLSQDVDSCKKKYDNPGNKEIYPALFDFPLKAGRYMNEGFAAFLKGKGRQMEEMTIEAFMVKLFKDPNYYQKWLTEDHSQDYENPSKDQ